MPIGKGEVRRKERKTFYPLFCSPWGVSIECLAEWYTGNGDYRLHVSVAQLLQLREGLKRVTGVGDFTYRR